MMAKGWLGKPEKLEWVLASIRTCAAKCPDGMTLEAKQAKLIGFIDYTREPRKDPDAPSSAPYHRESPPEPESGVVSTEANREAAMKALELFKRKAAG